MVIGSVRVVGVESMVVIDGLKSREERRGLEGKREVREGLSESGSEQNDLAVGESFHQRIILAKRARKMSMPGKATEENRVCINEREGKRERWKDTFGRFSGSRPSIISSSLSDWPRPGMLSRGQER